MNKQNNNNFALFCLLRILMILFQKFKYKKYVFGVIKTMKDCSIVHKYDILIINGKERLDQLTIKLRNWPIYIFR